MKNENKIDEVAKFQSDLADIMSVYNISAAELGRMVGVTRQQITNLRNGTTKLSEPLYLAIMAVLTYPKDKIKLDFKIKTQSKVKEKQEKLSKLIEGS